MNLVSDHVLLIPREILCSFQFCNLAIEHLIPGLGHQYRHTEHIKAFNETHPHGQQSQYNILQANPIYSPSLKALCWVLLHFNLSIKV